jgi:hypothetical protein
MKKFSTADDIKDISLTIYNGGFGAVKALNGMQIM